MRALRRLPALLLVLVAVVVAGGCADTYQVAARFGDVEISHDELDAELEAWAGADELLSQLQLGDVGGDGRYSQSLVTEVLNLKIQAERARIALAETPDAPEVTDADVEAVEAQFGVLFESFPADLARDVFADIAVLQVAGSVVAELPSVDVYVSPRYGTFDDADLVTPPPGPLPGPGTPLVPEA